MSLVDSDSILLDAAPFEIWIALRSDGLKGSGTQSDPYDGGTRAQAALAVTLSISGTEITADTGAVLHNYGENDVVTIAGVTGAGAASYNGIFGIHSVAKTTFKYYVPANVGSPAGSPTSALDPYLFDGVMRKAPVNTHIHIGPGVFETRGSAGGLFQPDWRPKSGQRIVGSGIGLTTLKIVGAANRNTQYYAIVAMYSELLTDFTASDFTVDCNSQGQASPHVACAAIGFGGGARRVRVRRVRAINFGSHAPDFYVENFVFFLGATHPAYVATNGQTSDVVYEDCIAEWPSPNVTANSTIFHMGGGEWTGGDETTEYHHGCAIRNCFVDARNVYGPIVPMASISFDGVYVTVTTKAPHQLTAPGNVLVRGVTVGGATDNLFNGLFAIAQIVSDTSLKYKLVTSGTPDGTNATLGGGVSTHPVQIQSITPDETLDSCPFLKLHVDQFYEPIRTYTITTLEPHFRTTNNNVSVGGVTKPGGSVSAVFNGAFVIDEVEATKPNQLVYTLLKDPDADPKDLVFTAGAFVGIGHQALSADNGIAAIVEGNRVYHATLGGPYHDTWQSRDVASRENWYHDVLYGPFQNLTGNSVSPWFDGIKLGSLTRSGSLATATIRTTPSQRAHGFTASADRVVIVGDISSDAPLYNGEFEVTATPDAYTFKYVMNGTPSGDASGARFRGADSRRENLRPLESLTRDANNPALITAVMLPLPDAPDSGTQSQKHGLEKGDIFWLIKAGYWNDIIHSPYHNIKVKVSSILSDTAFQFTLPADPGFDSVTHPLGAFSPGYFGRIWEFGRILIENNIIELGNRAINGGYGRSLGVFLYVGGSEPQFTGRQVVIRENVIRHVNNGFDPSGFSRAFEIYRVENVLIQNNIIRLDSDDSITQSRGMAYSTAESTIRTSFNWTPSGNLLRATLLSGPFTLAPELESTMQSEFEGALVSSFLKGVL